MGLYEREYYHEEAGPGQKLGLPQTVAGRLLLANVVLAVLDLFSPVVAGNAHWLGQTLALKPLGIEFPWNWWQFVSYGFVHAALDGPHWTHLLFNMMGLWIFGREIEARVGPREFLRFWLAAVVAGGVAAAVMRRLTGDTHASVVGASGAVASLIVLFALTWPHREVMLFFFPLPAWVLGLLLVAGDVAGALRAQGSQVAYEVHLAGAAFALAYHFGQWNLTALLPSWSDVRQRIRQPKLRVHAPPEAQQAGEAEVDRLLEKISTSGIDSLSPRERKVLEAHSRRLRQQRK